MNCFEAPIDLIAVNFFFENEKLFSKLSSANTLLKQVCGINNFFETKDDIIELFLQINKSIDRVEESNRRAYGDFQTNDKLTNEIAKYIKLKQSNFEFVLEPTCGKGSFILASLQHFDSIKRIVGVEIFLPYIWETKFRILSHFLTCPKDNIPNIDIFHEDAFNFSYKEIAAQTIDLNTLIIGNPPWITNSELGSIESSNLPQKSNFKKHSGFDAITGKGNFDIGEYISIMMLDAFQYHQGVFSFLIKNSVIKNIIRDQRVSNWRIANSEKHNIDSKKEFNAAVNASLFVTQLNLNPEFNCKEYDFYSHDEISIFGWYKNKFVSSIKDYQFAGNIDGTSFFTWRSGIKHDCSKVMEFEVFEEQFMNGYKVVFNIEKDLVYGLLKSSDLKVKQINSYRKCTIVTQRKIGQETGYIEWKYPLTYEYLNENRAFFDKRKSSIYRGKPSFSIFGVGDYSFKPYKLAISGLYKTTHFTLVLPDDEGKAIMLDDTCYFIGFDNLKHAQIAHTLVNSQIVQTFLKSIIFSDSKRSINKDILMRIDFEKAFLQTDFSNVKDFLGNITFEDWRNFGELISKSNKVKQMSLF